MEFGWSGTVNQRGESPGRPGVFRPVEKNTAGIPGDQLGWWPWMEPGMAVKGQSPQRGTQRDPTHMGLPCGCHALGPREAQGLRQGKEAFRLSKKTAVI